jgi:hypothetical protein
MFSFLASLRARRNDKRSAEQLEWEKQNRELVEAQFSKARAAMAGGVSNAQLEQDVFVLAETGFKRGGVFVEAGVTDGVTKSNTYVLEKQFGWTGIVVEPAPHYRGDAARVRQAKIDTDCLWRESGKSLEFVQPQDVELSTIVDFVDCDGHFDARRNGDVYRLPSVSLMALLERHSAPKVIDYLSLDTEGSEYEILKAFNFHKYKIKIITCEHNYTSNRDKIFNLLVRNGYIRKYQEWSEWDDWYVRA